MGDWFYVEPGGSQTGAVAFRDRRGQFHWFEPTTEKLHSAVWLTHAFADPEHRRSLGIQFESISRARARELVEQRVGEARAANYLQAVANDQFALELAPRLTPGAREIFPRPRARAFADLEQPRSILLDAEPHAIFQLDDHDVPANVLREAGQQLQDILTQRPLLHSDNVAADRLRRDGWRVVAQIDHSDDEQVVLATPDPELVDSWQILWLSRRQAESGWVISGGYEQKLRPGRAVRRAGVELRWAADQITMPAAELGSLTARLCNPSRRTWAMDPGDDPFTIAWITASDGTPVESVSSFTRSLVSGRPGARLRAGCGTEIRLFLAAKNPTQLSAGSYRISAHMLSLDLRAPPATLILT